MTKGDIVTFVSQVCPEMDPGLQLDLCGALLYHLEERIREEVLHLKEKFDQQNLILATPHDDVYWSYVLSLIYLIQGKMELYREYRKLFDEAWENLCRQAFRQKENFRLAPWYYQDKEGIWN